MKQPLTARTAIDAVAEAAGARVPALMLALEARLLELVAGHGDGVSANSEQTLAAGGKRLRPLVVFVAADAQDAGGVDEVLLRPAAAVELIHSATLVHDDVLDGARLRRGRPTVVASAGRAMATATGDLLFARAFAELAAGGRAAEVRVLSAASSALARGELLQRADAFAADVSEERCLLRCALKTASLFEAACQLGAMRSPGPVAAHVTALRDFGRRVGLAFQVLDDVLDVSGPAERTGKRRGSDLLDGTVTLPLILARARDPALASTPLPELADPTRLEATCDAIAACGALDEARERALRLVADAKSRLPALPERQLGALRLIADGVVERYA